MTIDRLYHALSQAEFWGMSAPVEVIETHISRVYLVGDRAYKQKKAVDLGFVDFTTLQRRKYYCEEELRLNKRLAPELYLGVRSVTGTVDRPQLDGRGDVLDYLVEMRRFDQAELLSGGEALTRLNKTHIDQLARRMALFHEACPVAAEESSFGSVQAVRDPVEGNFSHLLTDALPAELTARLLKLKQWADEEGTRLIDWFRQRQRMGQIRECHGDMHLGNMILRGETITVFDCIEFNDQFRWIDTISEVAFCTMDLTDRGSPELANVFLNASLEVTGDYAALPGLRFYLCYRALVRAKVAWLRFAQHPSDGSGELLRELENYVALAEQYAFESGPGVIVMRGVSGSGKSYGGAQIVRRLGAIRVRSDVERKRLAKSAAGELYSDAMTQATYTQLGEFAKLGIAAGQIMLLDATFLSVDRIVPIVELCEREQMPCRLLDLHAREQTLRNRVAQRQATGTDPSDANLAVLEQQLAAYESLPDDLDSYVISVNTEQAECWDETIRLLKSIFHHSR